MNGDSLWRERVAHRRGEIWLSLPLLVARIAANDVHHAPAAHDLALVTDSLHASFDFHRGTQTAISAAALQIPGPTRQMMGND
jgi:hypothetical protein